MNTKKDKELAVDLDIPEHFIVGKETNVGPIVLIIISIACLFLFFI